MPDPVFVYPLYYISFHTYALSGFMQNEFGGTGRIWGAPDGRADALTGAEVLAYWQVLDVNKWVVLAILAAMAAFYRVAFLATLHVKERKSR